MPMFNKRGFILSAKQDMHRIYVVRQLPYKALMAFFLRLKKVRDESLNIHSFAGDYSKVDK